VCCGIKDAAELQLNQEHVVIIAMVVLPFVLTEINVCQLPK